MTLQATTYRLSTRLAVAGLLIVSRTSLLVLGALLFVVHAPLSPRQLLQSFFVFFAVPELTARIAGRLLAAGVSVDPDTIVLHGRVRRLEIPRASVEAVSVWTLPVPSPGLWLRMKSGRRFRYGFGLDDPSAFVESAPQHPTAVYARAKALARSKWDHPLFKIVLFSLVPTLPLWRLHQYLNYGGTFGEYYQYGPRAYLIGFALYWLLTAIYVLVFAAALRAVTEAVSISAAWAAPSEAAKVRRAAEIAHRVIYYAGVPAVLIVRLWPW